MKETGEILTTECGKKVSPLQITASRAGICNGYVSEIHTGTYTRVKPVTGNLRKGVVVSGYVIMDRNVLDYVEGEIDYCLRHELSQAIEFTVAADVTGNMDVRIDWENPNL